MPAGFQGFGSAAGFVGTVVFGPPTLPDLVAWYRADLGITTVTGAVSAWADQSGVGTGKTLAQGTAANRPAYNASDAGYNNQPTMTFDGSNDRLASGAWSAYPSSPTTGFIVGNTNGVPSQQVYFDSISAQRYLFDNNSELAGDDLRFFRSNGVLGANGKDSSIKHIAGFVDNGVSSSLYWNSATNVGTGNSGASSPTGLTVGSDQAQTGGFLSGKIAEIIIYSRALSAQEIAALLNYFGTRYGITIT